MIICFRFCNNFKYFWDMLEIPDFLGVTCQAKYFLGYRADAGAQPM